MSESKLWSDHVSRLRAWGEVDRIEDALKAGTSDCVYALRCGDKFGFGWIELKRLPAWPKRRTTPIILHRYTAEQANYLCRWGRAGVGAWLLAQVGNEYFLFNWTVAHGVREGLGRNAFVAHAAVHGIGRFPAGKVVKCLTDMT